VSTIIVVLVGSINSRTISATPLLLLSLLVLLLVLVLLLLVLLVLRS